MNDKLLEFKQSASSADSPDSIGNFKHLGRRAKTILEIHGQGIIPATQPRVFSSHMQRVESAFLLFEDDLLSFHKDPETIAMQMNTITILELS